MVKNDPHFRLRIPAELKARITDAAKRNNRSINAEIVNALEDDYPAPITLDEVVTDIQETIRILHRFKGTSTLMVLADSLDRLMLDVAHSKEGSSEDRLAAQKHVEERGKFNRFIAPDED